MEKIDFAKLEYALRHGIEMDFYYNGICFGIYNFSEPDSAWWIVCSELNIDYKICAFKDFNFLIDFISKYKIDGKTIKEIFDNFLYEEGSIGGIPSDYFDGFSNYPTMEKMTYEDLCEHLLMGDEFGFGYGGKEYEFAYGFEEPIYAYFFSKEEPRGEKICGFDEKEKLIDFIKVKKIGNKTIKQIFEEGLNY